MGRRFYNKKGIYIMKCITCGAMTIPGLTTDVTELGKCLVIVRNVPCYKCSECNEIIYTADIVKSLEKITKNVENTINEVSVIDYNGIAA